MTDESLDAIIRGRLGPRREQPAFTLPDDARIAVWTILIPPPHARSVRHLPGLYT